MSNQPLLMQGEELVFQVVASFASGKVFREGNLFLTSQRLIWKKMSGIKAGMKAGGSLLVGAISATGKDSYSIPLNIISAIGPIKKNGVEFLTTDGDTYKFTVLPSGFRIKGLEEKRDAIIAYIQEKILNNQ